MGLKYSPSPHKRFETNFLLNAILANTEARAAKKPAYIANLTPSFLVLPQLPLLSAMRIV